MSDEQLRDAARASAADAQPLDEEPVQHMTGAELVDLVAGVKSMVVDTVGEMAKAPPELIEQLRPIRPGIRTVLLMTADAAAIRMPVVSRNAGLAGAVVFAIVAGLELVSTAKTLKRAGQAANPKVKPGAAAAAAAAQQPGDLPRAVQVIGKEQHNPFEVPQ